MFFTSTGLVYHGCTHHTEFELASYHLQGKAERKKVLKKKKARARRYINE